ncbi:MAG: ferritin family protein, partial [candidate division Zixibacteria bacterium]|nr:ferritin family protein [candidate division Zixibacteria bacterium]
MDEKKKQVVEGLIQAIKAERYGHTFYLMAARSTEDPKGKEVFEMLAHEELYHMQFLRNQYDSILETGVPSQVEKLNTPADLTGMSPIFSNDLRKRIKDANFEMTCLSIGIRLEMDSMNFYRSQADAADNSEIKKFYGQLAEWESGHYQA